jgi:hypothetical protein
MKHVLRGQGAISCPPREAQGRSPGLLRHENDLSNKLQFRSDRKQPRPNNFKTEKDKFGHQLLTQIQLNNIESYKFEDDKVKQRRTDNSRYMQDHSPSQTAVITHQCHPSFLPLNATTRKWHYIA